MIDEDAFVEWEEVYKNSYYGTRKAEVERIWRMDRHVLFDVDVMGGVNLKRIFGEKALAIFIMPPSIEVLKERLEQRGTESEEKIRNRINKATLEIKFAKMFDITVLNDNLSETFTKIEKLAADFLKQSP
jgi:guanylate kinase